MTAFLSRIKPESRPVQGKNGFRGAWDSRVGSFTDIDSKLSVQCFRVIVGWNRVVEIGTHITHPVSGVDSLEFLVARKLGQPPLKVFPHLWKDHLIRSGPPLGGSTHPSRHKLTDQSQPLWAPKTVVV